MSRVALLLLTSLLGCKKLESSGAACGFAEDGGVLDVSQRADGLYALRDDRVDPTPLVTFDRMTRTGEGLEPYSGKRWIGIRLGDPDAQRVRDFTSEKEPKKKMAVVAGGTVASIHKVKEPVTSPAMKISCCEPRACERWSAILDRPK